MKYSYEQIGAVCATFRCHDNVQPGQSCQMMDNDCICLAEEDSDFDGVVISRRGDCATVAMRGFVTLPYSGNTLYAGSRYLHADGIGGVTAAEEGKMYVIVNVDMTNKIVTFLM